MNKKLNNVITNTLTVVDAAASMVAAITGVVAGEVIATNITTKNDGLKFKSSVDGKVYETKLWSKEATPAKAGFFEKKKLPVYQSNAHALVDGAEKATIFAGGVAGGLVCCEAYKGVKALGGLTVDLSMKGAEAAKQKLASAKAAKAETADTTEEEKINCDDKE